MSKDNEINTSFSEDDRQHSGWFSLFREIINYGKKKLLTAFFLVILSAFVESLGLILLIPLVEIILLDTPVTAVSQAVSGFLKDWGASLWWHRMLFLFSIFFTILLFRAFILHHRDIIIMKLSQGFVDHIRIGLLSDLAHSSWSIIQSMQKAQLLDSLTVNISRIGSAIRFFTQSVIAISFSIFFIATAFVINPSSGLLLLSITILVISIATFWLKKSRILGGRMTQTNQGISKETTRFLDSLKAAKAARAENIFVENFAEAVKKSRSVSVEFARQQARMRRGVEILGAFFGLLLVFLGYGFFDLTASEILLVGAILIRLVSVLNGGLGSLQSAAYALPAFEAAQALRKTAKKNSVLISRSELTIAPDFTNISISKLRFSFSQNENVENEYILRSGEITMPPTGLVLIEGPSGAGKTTFVDILSGLLYPNEGVLSFGDLQLTENTQSQWQSNITYVVQDDFMFDGTVRENILWPDSGANVKDSQIWQALKDAKIDEIVRALPNGLDENLRSNGLRLSGGERQRIGLARGFLKSTPIFIIDEGLSALGDDITEHIIRALKQRSKNQTIILISHNSNHRKYADARIHIDDGKIQFLT